MRPSRSDGNYIRIISLFNANLHIFCDLLGISVLSQKTSQNSLSSHPENFLGHSGVSSTLSLTLSLMSALALGLVESLDSGVRVHVHLTSHDQTVLVKLPDVLSCHANC